MNSFVYNSVQFSSVYQRSNTDLYGVMTLYEHKYFDSNCNQH